MPRSSARKRGYTTKWQKESAAWLVGKVCKFCAELGKKVPATTVDHIVPHKGNPKLFWDRSNWQPLCTHCHSSVKQSMEVTGRRRGCGVNGLPLDPNHPWNGGSRDAWVERPSSPRNLPKPAIPVTMVCGPPAAGKTTYVRQHAAKDDLVIDLDEIIRGLAGRNYTDHQERYWIARALRERNQILRSLSEPGRYRRCWFIICAADRLERDWWARQLNAEVVLLETPEQVCIERIESSNRAGFMKLNRATAVQQWWARHRRTR